jgi:hypothetical protein
MLLSSWPHSQRVVPVSTGSTVEVRKAGVVKGQLGWQTDGISNAMHLARPWWTGRDV